MHLPERFYQLPLLFDVDRLQFEVGQFAESAWTKHPQSYAGNTSLVLVSARGEINDVLNGPMLPTEHLRVCPYLQQVMSTFDTIVGRSRLMRVAGDHVVPKHSDIAYYWQNRVRIHVPIITHESVRFFCEDESVHMAAGEAWVFDNWRQHRVENNFTEDRIHLVIDTVGTPDFWNLVYQHPYDSQTNHAPQLVPFDESSRREMRLEKTSNPHVMSPEAVDGQIAKILSDCSVVESEEIGTELKKVAWQFQRGWRALFVEFGEQEAAISRYRQLRDEFREQLKPFKETVRSPISRNNLLTIMNSQLLSVCLNEDPIPETVVKQPQTVETKAKVAPHEISNQNGRVESQDCLNRPFFLIGTPCSGTDLLFDALCHSDRLVGLSQDAHRAFESHPKLHPRNRNFDSNVLNEQDLTDEIHLHVVSRFQDAVAKAVFEQPEVKNMQSVRLLERSAKNMLRIPFLKAVFPDARFVYMTRNAEEELAGLLSGWQSQQFVSYRNLPGWKGLKWSYLLTPDWRSLVGKPLPETVVIQWKQCHETAMRDLQNLEQQDYWVVSYERFLQGPADVFRELASFAELDFDQALDRFYDESEFLSGLKKNKKIQITEQFQSELARLKEVYLPTVESQTTLNNTSSIKL